MSHVLRLSIAFAVLGTMVIGRYALVPVSANSTYIAPPELVPVDTNMHDFMEGMFQLPYRRLKEAMASEPKDNGGWKAIRSDVLILAEGCNLLLTRKPEQDEAKWFEFSLASKKDGESAFKAAKAKNFAETRTAYESMLTHCNECHTAFSKGKPILTP